MYHLVVSGSFCAAHKLPGYLGDCATLHGHTFQVEVKVKSEFLNDMDMVVDFKLIKDCWRIWDHKYLNDFFDMPTAENLAADLYASIMKLVPGATVEYVRIWESENCYAEVTS